MSEREKGLSPSQQIQQAEYKQKLHKVKEAGGVIGKVYLFDNHSHAVFNPSTGLIEINKSRGLEKEVDQKSVEVKFGPSGRMDLPTAIAQVFHIVDEFELSGGRVTNQDRAVLDMAELLIDWWSNLPISEQERQQKHSEVVKILEETNYFASKDPRRKKMREYLTRGIGRDSLDRINPEAMKVLVACAAREGKRRETKNRAIFVKYGLQLLPDLIMQREEERKRLGRTIIAVDELLNMSSVHLQSYAKKLTNFRQERLSELLNPFIIKTAPLVFPAAETLVELGSNLLDPKKRRLELILGEEKYLSIISSREISNWKQLTKALQHEVVIRDLRIFTDPMLVKIRNNLAKALQNEQAKMDEEMDKRHKRLANHPQAGV